MGDRVLRFYFLLREDAREFTEQVAAPLQKAGFQAYHSYNDWSNRSSRCGYWLYAAFDTCILTIASDQDDSDSHQAITEPAVLKQCPNALDMILGQTTVIISKGPSFENVLGRYKTMNKDYSGTEIAVKDGRLMRYGLSPTESLYIAQPDALDSPNLNFLARRLAALEAHHLNLNMVCRLLKDQEDAVSRESAALDRELSLILHANLVSTHGEQKEAEELAGKLQDLATSYGKIAGSSHLVSKGMARLETLLNQFTRQVKEEPVLLPPLTPFLAWIDDYEELLQRLNLTAANLHASQQNFRAAIEVVQSRINIMNSRSNLATQAQIRALMEQNTEMQKKSLVFQYAAGLIEFIVLAYYSHSLWKNLAYGAYLLIPTPLQFIVVLLFSGTAVYVTHLLAEYMQGERGVKQRMILSVLFLAMLLVLIIVGSILAGMPGTAAP